MASPHTPARALGIAPHTSAPLSGQRRARSPAAAETPGTVAAGSPQQSSLQEVDCCVCMDLLTNAHQTPCCGTLMCLACLDKVAADTKHCPLCRKPLRAGSGLRDVRMERAAANTVRGCEHPGCDYRGKRDELRAHAADCPMVSYEVRLGDVRRHLSAAPEVRVAFERFEARARRDRDEMVATLDQLRSSLLWCMFSSPPHKAQFLSFSSSERLWYCSISAQATEGFFCSIRGPEIFSVVIDTSGPHVTLSCHRSPRASESCEAPKSREPAPRSHVFLHPTNMRESLWVDLEFPELAGRENARTHTLQITPDAFKATFVCGSVFVFGEGPKGCLALGG